MDPRRAWQGGVSEERRYNLDLLPHGYRFQTGPLPLGVIYLLRTDARPTSVLGFETVRAQDALMSLVANTFAARLVRSADRAKEFELLAHLVAAVPVRRLHNGGSLDRLPDLCAAIQSDVSQFVVRRLRPAH
jgi:hypothetical protein